MGLFSSPSKSRIGVDIGTASIKIAELAKESNRFTITNYGLLEFEPGADVTASAPAIREILDRAGMKSRDAVASIPSFPTFSTTITMPYLAGDELAKAMPFEARKYIPVPLSDVQLDWAPVSVKKESKMMEVFLVAVPKEEVARYQTIMKEAGLTLRALELENFALIRAIIGNDLSPIAIVNIGGKSTSILIAHNGFQRANHTYEVGGFHLTKSIAKSLGINLRRAEEMKRNYGLQPSQDNVIRQAMSSLVDSMVLEATKTIHNFEDQQKVAISRILMVGGMVNMKGFVSYFSEKLGRQAVAGNALARIVVPPSLEPLRAELNATFTVAFGLAMREF